MFKSFTRDYPGNRNSFNILFFIVFIIVVLTPPSGTDFSPKLVRKNNFYNSIYVKNTNSLVEITSFGLKSVPEGGIKTTSVNLRVFL